MIQKSFVFAVLIFLLSSCGFTLRGNYLIPESAKTIYLQSFDKHASLTKTLRRQLKIYDIQVVDAQQVRQLEKPPVVIRLAKDKLDRRTLSLLSTGQVAEHELIYTVEYQIIFPGQQANDYKLELLRDYQDDPNAVLAKSRELDILLNELRLQASDKIIRQLAEYQ